MACLGGHCNPTGKAGSRGITQNNLLLALAWIIGYLVAMTPHQRHLELAPKLAQLAKLATGIHPVNKPWWKSGRGGWLSVSVDEQTQQRRILWCTDRDTHDPFQGCAFSLTISPLGRIDAAFESALTMHMTWNGCAGYNDDDALESALDRADWMHAVLCQPILETSPKRKISMKSR